MTKEQENRIYAIEAKIAILERSLEDTTLDSNSFKEISSIVGNIDALRRELANINEEIFDN